MSGVTLARSGDEPTSASADILADLSLYLHLTAADVRAQMQYKASFLINVVGSFFSLLLEFAVILVLFGRFPQMAGWSVGEVAFLYGLASMSFGLAEMVSGGFDRFSTLIVQGTFDQIMVRPVDPFVQLFSREFQLRRLGRIAQGLAAFLVANWLVGIYWTAPKLIYLPVVLASGAVLFASIFIIGATLCFWTVQSIEIVNVFTNGGTEMASYPMDIYADWFRRFFIFVIPLAFVTYFPALYFLGRPDGLGMPGFFPFLPPVVATIFFVVARAIWGVGVRHYQSTGS